MQGRVNRANVKKQNKTIFKCRMLISGQGEDSRQCVKVKCQRESSKKGLSLLFILRNDCGGNLLKVAPVCGGLVLKAMWFV